MIPTPEIEAYRAKLAAMESHPYQAEFDKNYYSKKAIEWMLERMFKPEKYTDFHDYLHWVHEHWIKGQKK